MLAITCIVVYISYIPYIPDAYTPAIPAYTCTCNTAVYTAYSLRVIEEVVTYVLHLFRLCVLLLPFYYSVTFSLTAFML